MPDQTLRMSSLVVLSPEAVLEDEGEEEEDARGKSGSSNAEKWRLEVVTNRDEARVLGNSDSDRFFPEEKGRLANTSTGVLFLKEGDPFLDCCEVRLFTESLGKKVEVSSVYSRWFWCSTDAVIVACNCASKVERTWDTRSLVGICQLFLSQSIPSQSSTDCVTFAVL